MDDGSADETSQEHEHHELIPEGGAEAAQRERPRSEPRHLPDWLRTVSAIVTAGMVLGAGALVWSAATKPERLCSYHADVRWPAADRVASVLVEVENASSEAAEQAAAWLEGNLDLVGDSPIRFVSTCHEQSKEARKEWIDRGGVVIHLTKLANHHWMGRIIGDAPGPARAYDNVDSKRIAEDLSAYLMRRSESAQADVIEKLGYTTDVGAIQKLRLIHSADQLAAFRSIPALQDNCSLRLYQGIAHASEARFKEAKATLDDVVRTCSLPQQSLRLARYLLAGIHMHDLGQAADPVYVAHEEKQAVALLLEAADDAGVETTPALYVVATYNLQVMVSQGRIGTLTAAQLDAVKVKGKRAREIASGIDVNLAGTFVSRRPLIEAIAARSHRWENDYEASQGQQVAETRAHDELVKLEIDESQAAKVQELIEKLNDEDENRKRTLILMLDEPGKADGRPLADMNSTSKSENSSSPRRSAKKVATQVHCAAIRNGGELKGCIRR
jgi:hypothetical protein